LNAIEATAAMRAGRAAATIAPAAVERPVTGDAVVVTGDGAAVLAALIRRRALATEANRAAAATTTAADAVDALETTATIRILGTGAAIVPAAVEGAVGVDAVRCTDGCAAGLAALPGLIALGPNSQSAGRVVRADAVDAIEATTAVGAIAHAGAGASLVATTVERPVTIEAVVGADGRPTALGALLR